MNDSDIDTKEHGRSNPENIDDLEKLSPEKLREALHDLQVHKIELEIQNDELKKAQSELVRQRESYYHLFHMAPIGYALVDEKGIVRKANRLLAEIFGLSSLENVGLSKTLGLQSLS